MISVHKTLASAPFDSYHKNSDNDFAVWISPDIVFTVKYMEKSKSGSLRQPVFKGIRDDKSAKE